MYNKGTLLLGLLLVGAAFATGCAGSDDGGGGAGCVDLDGDGYGAGCSAGEDCDDGDATLHLMCGSTGGNCIDRDGDGYGMGSDCRGLDCNDSDPAVNSDCACTDADNDQYGIGSGCRGPDCDDSDPTVNPGRIEVPGNGKDDNCDGQQTNCVDADGDGYGMGTDCRRAGVDCDDANRQANPGAREVCGNNVDEDCDGTPQTCAANCSDMDGDGYGAGDGCTGGDCNDIDPTANEGAMETCNGKDDDCDNMVDECAEAGKECDLTRGGCFNGFLQACTTTTECAAGYACDDQKCLGTSGITCEAGQPHCARGFRCGANSKCEIDPDYDPCDELTCTEPTGSCIRELGCVACIDAFDCAGADEACAGFSCLSARFLDLYDDATAIRDVAQFAVDCSNLTANADAITFCGVFDTTELSIAVAAGAVDDFVCDDADENTFIGGSADLGVAEGTFGCGLFDNDDYEWPATLQPGVSWEVCMWGLPEGGLFDGEPTVVIKDCLQFPINGE